jgi:hypothetical protein
MSKAKELTESINMMEIANLRPENTGLSFFVWVDEMGEYRKDKHSTPRIKLAKNNPKNFIASISIDKNPVVLAGDVKAEELTSIKKWINLNFDLLMKHWKGNIDTVELFKNLQKGRITEMKEAIIGCIEDMKDEDHLLTSLTKWFNRTSVRSGIKGKNWQIAKLAWKLIHNK